MLVVFAFAELRRIDEDGDDDALRMPASEPDKAQMTLVKVAHGRHQRDVITGVSPASGENFNYC